MEVGMPEDGEENENENENERKKINLSLRASCLLHKLDARKATI